MLLVSTSFSKTKQKIIRKIVSLKRIYQIFSHSSLIRLCVTALPWANEGVFQCLLVSIINFYYLIFNTHLTFILSAFLLLIVKRQNRYFHLSFLCLPFELFVLIFREQGWCWLFRICNNSSAYYHINYHGWYHYCSTYLSFFLKCIYLHTIHTQITFFVLWFSQLFLYLRTLSPQVNYAFSCSFAFQLPYMLFNIAGIYFGEWCKSPDMFSSDIVYFLEVFGTHS